MKGVIGFLVLAVIALAVPRESEAANGSDSLENKDFVSLYNQRENTCQCAKQICNCCFTTPGLECKTCINYTLFIRQKKLKITASMEGLTVLESVFPFVEKNQRCVPLPDKVSPGVTLCLNQQNKQQKDGTIQSCNALAFKTNAAGSDLIVRFKCLTVKSPQLSFDGNKFIVSKEQVFQTEISSNFKAIVDGLRKGSTVPTLRPEPVKPALPAPQLEPVKPAVPTPQPEPVKPAGNQVVVNSSFLQEYKANENVCRCLQQACICCFITPGLEDKTCINYTHFAGVKRLKARISMEGVEVITKNFVLAPKDQYCRALPAQQLGLNYCLHIQNAPQKDGSVQSCLRLAIEAVSSTLNINFKCLTLKKTGLTVGGLTLVENNVINIQSNGNFKAAVGSLRK